MPMGLDLERGLYDSSPHQMLVLILRCLRTAFLAALLWTGLSASHCIFKLERAWALTLTTPAPGTVLLSGGSSPVAVAVGKDLSLRAIHYHWYRMDEEPLASHQARPAAFSRDGDGALSTGTVAVPPEALGTMRLLAVGEVVRGRLDSLEEFDEVVVTVETAAELQAIEFAVEKPWRLQQAGRRIPIPAVGQFGDGVSRPLVGSGVGSRFYSSDERVVSVDAAGVLEVRGSGKTTVTVENRGKSGTVEVVVDADGEPNRAPIAKVAEDLRVRSGDLVLLDGMGSYDPDGDPLHFEWRQILGHRVALNNVNEAKATFVAPKVSEPKRYRFSLVVTDMAGPDTMRGADSPPAIITVWVNP